MHNFILGVTRVVGCSYKKVNKLWDPKITL